MEHSPEINIAEARENISEKYFKGRLELLNRIFASRAADYVPGVGLFKMGAESVIGKGLDGKILTKAERLEKGLIVLGNSLAAALQAAGAPAEGLVVGSSALEGAARSEYILQKIKEMADKLKEKWQ